MPRLTSHFTPTEAAALTRVPLKAVNNAIDKKIICSPTGTPARVLTLGSLLALILERRLADRFTPELRRTLYNALANANPRQAITLEGDLLTIDLTIPRQELATALRALRAARRLVTTDPGTMGGDPVFRGTRLQVHLIATLAAQSPASELLQSYPRLTPEMLRAAPLHATAYPLRGRPRASSWQNQPPTQITRREIPAIAAE